MVFVGDGLEYQWPQTSGGCDWLARLRLQRERSMTVSEEKFTRQRLLEVQTLTPTLFTLRTTRDPGFRFTAGQFARLVVRKPSGSIVWRAYSMVSAPHDEFLDFFSIVVPDGEFTSELSRLEPGDELLIDKQAFGFLTLDRFPD